MNTLMTKYLQRQYEIEDPNFVANYDELTFWSSRFGALLIDNLELRDSIDILDVGCGTGFPLIELAGIHGPACRLTAIDPWKGALNRVRAKAALHGFSNITVIDGDAAQIPLDAGSFDLIVSNLGVNNFEDVDGVLRELHRVARRGARLVLTTNVRGHMKEFYGVFRELLTGNPAALERLEKNEAHRGSKEDLVQRVAVAGFTTTRVIESSFPFRFVNGTALLNHPLVFWFLGGWRSVVNPEDEVATFSELERRLNEKARRDGELRTTIPMLYLEAEKQS
jgi:arsenite methyltransferase